MHPHASRRGVARPALHQCSRCPRRYHRTEHLARHVRSVHTKQRPYACGFCGKAFGRLDILKRHEATHGGEPRARPHDGGLGDRVARACTVCKAAKVKCSERKPCARCTGKGVICEYEGIEEGAGEEMRDEEQRQQYSPTRPEGVVAAGDAVLVPLEADRALKEAPLPTARFPHLPTPDAAQNTPTYEEDPFTTEDLTVGFDWDLAMADLAYLQTQLDDAGTDAVTALVFAPDSAQQPLTPMSPAACETLSAEGSWEPQSSENTEMERPHLAVDEANLRPPKPKPKPPAAAAAGPAPLSVAVPCLSAAARSGIIGMILDNTSRANAAPVLAAFPSAGALDALVGVCARDWEAAAAAAGGGRTDDVVHLPTLDPEGQRPELLGALVAVGALGAGSTVARKFGFAMQEVVWMSTFRSWERNNAEFRDIGLSQAFFLQQRIAFFSGVRRKVAFAEACSNTMQVLIKNGGHLRGAAAPGVDVSRPDDLRALDGPSLGDAWRRWSLREARRRLVYAAYVMDAHVSMAHGTQVLSSYPDMRVPFPAPRRLWRAETAERWREEMTALPLPLPLPLPPSPLCLRDVMGDPALVARHGGLVDGEFVVLGFLAGFWALVRECQQLGAIGGGARSPWGSMILSARRVELASTLRLFVSCAEGAGLGVSPQAELLVEVLHMHVLTPPPSPSLPFATAAYDAAVLETTEHRGALWRAGRAVRAAVRLPPGTLCDVYVVALAQAAKLLCRHGVLAAQAWGQDPGGGTEICVLDGDEAREHEVLGGAARLALRGAETDAEAGPVVLEDAAGVARRVRRVVEGNWREARMPSGAEEVCRALEDLEGAAARRHGAETMCGRGP